MKVSVVIPVYNRDYCIAEALDSALGQTYRNTELIVVDDGSTDRTAEAVAPYRGRVRYLYQQNAGPSRARNRGVRESTGDLVAFLDSDDLWMPQKLDRQVEAFRADDGLGIIATAVVFRSPSREVKAAMPSMETEALREHFLDGFLMVTSSVMVRKRCFDDVGLFDESLFYAEDMDLFYRIARAYRARMLGDYLTVNRREPERNLMTDPSKRERLIADTTASIERIFSFPENRHRRARKQNRYRTFFRWIGLSDLYANPRFARKYLFKALSYRPWDYGIYKPLLQSFLINGSLYRRLKTLKTKLATRNS